jgi:hypothetical protein
MNYDEMLLLKGAATLLASSAVLLLGACFTWWRDFGARPHHQPRTHTRHVTQLPHYA